VIVAPLDFGERWLAVPLVAASQLALEAGIEPAQLVAYLEREIARRQAEALLPAVTATATNGSGAEP
jgi:hypothetical protein